MAEQHGKSTVVYLDSFDISGWITNADESADRDKAEVSAFGDNVKQYLPGLADGNLALQGNYEGGTAATTIDGILSPRQGTLVTAMVFPRGDLTPGFEGTFYAGYLKTYSMQSAITDAVRLTAGIHGGGPYPGIVIQERAAFTATGNGASVDNAASSAFGGRAQFHVLANTIATSSVLKVQHSVDNTAWTDLITFTTLGPATIGSQHAQVSGTINRYLRLTHTLTGAGSITVAAAFWRGIQ